MKRARNGHFVQGCYKAILVEQEEYAKELSRYIHLNQVRASLVPAPEDYAWSSCNYYIGEKKTPEWSRRDFIVGYFGSKVSVSQQAYQKSVQSLGGEEYDSPLKDVVGSVLLGSRDSINSIKQKFVSKSYGGKRARGQIDIDRELKKRVQTIEKKLRIASFKTPCFSWVWRRETHEIMTVPLAFLRCFGKTEGETRNAFRNHVESGLDGGRPA